MVNVRSRIERQFGSNRSAYLEATQRGDQLIRGFEPSTFKRGWYNSAHRFKLLRWIGSQIGFSRLDVGVAEPERNLADIPGGLQYHHRRRVSQNMGGDSLFLQGWTTFGSHMSMLSEYILKARTGHRLSVSVDEEFRSGQLATHGQPGAQIRGGLFPER